MLPAKKAARRTPEAATTNPRHQTYAPARTPSRRFYRQLFSGCPDRRPAQPPSLSLRGGAAALSLLVVLLALQSTDLAPKHRRLAAGFAEQWARQIVDVEHALL
jgi:hypothetical protein